jgi:hypothetical protein
MTVGAPDVSFRGMKVVLWVATITVAQVVPCFIFPDSGIPCGMLVLATCGLNHGVANNLTPSLPCTSKLPIYLGCTGPGQGTCFLLSGEFVFL